MSNATNINTFSLTPGIALGEPFDYLTSLGMKQWSESTKKLGDELFYGGINSLRMFLERLETRVEVSGRKSLCKVYGKSLFTEYGIIFVEECKDNAKKYFAQDKQGNIKTSRDVQLSQWMIVCIKQ